MSNKVLLIDDEITAKTKLGKKIKKIVKSKLDEYPDINLDWKKQYDII